MNISEVKLPWPAAVQQCPPMARRTHNCTLVPFCMYKNLRLFNIATHKAEVLVAGKIC